MKKEEQTKSWGYLLKNCFFCYEEVYHPEYMQPPAIRQVRCPRHIKKED